MGRNEEQLHSLTPWEASGDLVWSPTGKAVVAAMCEPRGSTFCQYKKLALDSPDFNEASANQDLIVNAVNHHHKYKAALEAITRIAGNLTDEAVESVGGVNDARSRALMVITARQIAQNALAEKES